MLARKRLLALLVGFVMLSAAVGGALAFLDSQSHLAHLHEPWASGGERHQVASLAVDPRGPYYSLDVDVIVDEEFAALFGPDWESEVRSMVADANGLLQGVGVQVVPSSLGLWRSDDARHDVQVLIADAAQRAPQWREGRVLVALTGQDTGHYDGFASHSHAEVLLAYHSGWPRHRAALFAHEMAHLLGAQDHGEGEEECIDAGCIMDERGYQHADTWCEHHAEVIGRTLAVLNAR